MRDNRISEINPIKFWNQTDKKTAQSLFWKPVKQEQKIKKASDGLLKNAAEAAFMTLPLITAGGIQMMCDKNSGYFDFRPLGLPIAIGGIVLDTIKAPFCIAVATGEGIAGGLTKLASLLFDKSPSQQAIDHIFKSFLIRMRETATLLVALQLEAPDVLNEKLKSGDIEELLALTLLHTAYVSRHESGLLLASEKRLYRTDCPVEGLPLFDAISELKGSINKALRLADDYSPRRHGDERDLAESRVACNWIKFIKDGKLLTAEDKPGATDEQLAIANDIIVKIAHLKELGLQTLPESSDSVARHIPSM